MFQNFKVKDSLKIVLFVSLSLRKFMIEADVQRMHTLEAVKVGVICLFLICFFNFVLFCSSEWHLWNLSSFCVKSTISDIRNLSYTCYLLTILRRLYQLSHLLVSKRQKLNKRRSKKPRVELFPVLFVDPSQVVVAIWTCILGRNI